MKNKLKGFTLVELIVVMVIMSLLMAGIMQLFKPMRTVYVDSTQYEAQRTAQNGVVTYITESTRFATDLGIYDTKKGVSSASAAAEELAKQYCINNGIIDKTSGNAVAPYDSTEVNNIKNEVKKYAEIILIANNNENAHTYNGKTYTGRLLRRKFSATSTAVPADPTITNSKATADWRIAMGEAYYGANTFSINLAVKDGDSDGVSDDGMLGVAVASSRNGKRDISHADGTTDIYSGTVDNTKVTLNVTNGSVLCRNLAGAGSNGVSKAGVFDVSKYSGSSATSGQKTYIVFLNKDGRDKVDAVVKAAAATP